MTGRYLTRLSGPWCLAGLVILAAPNLSVGCTYSSAHGVGHPKYFTVAKVSSTFEAVGLPLREIQVSPSLVHQVVLYYLDPRAFSLTVFVEGSRRQATQTFRDLSPGWRHDGWPSRLLRNIVVGIQPVGMQPGDGGRMRPMPKPVLESLTRLSREAK